MPAQALRCLFKSLQFSTLPIVPFLPPSCVLLHLSLPALQCQILYNFPPCTQTAICDPNPNFFCCWQDENFDLSKRLSENKIICNALQREKERLEGENDVSVWKRVENPKVLRGRIRVAQRCSDKNKKLRALSGTVGETVVPKQRVNLI